MSTSATGALGCLLLSHWMQLGTIAKHTRLLFSVMDELCSDRMTVAETRRLKRVGKAVEEFLDRVGS